MYSHQTIITPRYAETDQMGFVYHGNYAIYFEVARVEALKNIGFDYAEFEKTGINMPVISIETIFKKPAFYDKPIAIHCSIHEMPALRVVFHYESFNEAGELLNTAVIKLVFVNKSSGRPVRVPSELAERLKEYFI